MNIRVGNGKQVHAPAGNRWPYNTMPLCNREGVHWLVVTGNQAVTCKNCLGILANLEGAWNLRS